jgi:ubiquinone/menaquinone biosynthesis C-methylase UbiE
MQWGTAASFPAVYEELNVPAFFSTFADLLLDRAQLVDGERVLDVATGTGIVLRRARERCPSVGATVGLDLTPAMLEVARERSSAEIEYVEGDATSLPFPDASFDVVICQQGLQFFPDRSTALAEFSRVLSDGGRVVAACWCEIATCPGYQAIAETLAVHLPELVGTATHPFSLWDEVELRQLLEDAGFAQVEVERATADARYDSAGEFARGYMQGTPLSIPLAAVDAPTKARIAAAIIERIGKMPDDPVATTMSTNIAVGIRPGTV